MVGWMTTMQKHELMEEIEKKIDADKSRRFFKHIFRCQEFKDLHYPHINNMPKTLTTLVSVGYASGSAPTGNLDLSSQSSANDSRKEWSEVFGGDGRLRFNQILSSFPPSPDLSIQEQYLYRQSLCHAHYAVTSYNENHGADYELVAPIMSLVFTSMKPVFRELFYVNFFAKPKNSDSSPDLFFAEVVACGFSANEVLRCLYLDTSSISSCHGF